MIPYSIYKIVHLCGILMVFLAVGGLATHVINGGSRDHSFRKGIAITRGIGMFLSLLGGFGALARLGLASNGLPGWVIVKLVIWLFFAIITAVLIRNQKLAKPLWIASLILGIVSAYLAGYKPF